jgi:hypothetical protein
VPRLPFLLISEGPDGFATEMIPEIVGRGRFITYVDWPIADRMTRARRSRKISHDNSNISLSGA